MSLGEEGDEDEEGADKNQNEDLKKADEDSKKN